MKQHFLIGLFIIAFLGFLWSCTDASNDPSSNSIYLERGKQIAANSFATLSWRLHNAIQEGGIPNAIQYCNLAAYPLTDSLSTAHNVIIRRTSLNYRNPANKPTELEKSVLEEYASNMEKNQPLQPIIKQTEQQKHFFFAPILVHEPCLNCHGKLTENIVESNYQLLQSLYPEDKATGYKKGALRGMWSVEFLDKK